MLKAGAYGKMPAVMSLALLSILCSCAAPATEENSEALIDTMFSEDAADVVYEDAVFPMPEHIPGVMVDLAGYDAEAGKYVMCLGNDLDGSFALINADTEECVYTGELLPLTEDGEENRTLWRGDFSAVEEAGNYYIQTARIGRSLDFAITEDLYEKQRLACLARLYEPEGFCVSGDGGADVLHGAGMAINLLMAYSCETGVFTDDQIPELSGNDIPDILDEVRSETDCLMRLQRADGGFSQGEEEVSLEGTAAALVALAEYSNICAAFDSDYAESCLNAARKAYVCLSALHEDRTSAHRTWWYMINAAMFKADGDERYHNEIRRLIDTRPLPVNTVFIGEVDPVFIGDYIYLSTAKYADRELCRQIMEGIMEKVREIAESSETDPWFADRSGGDGEMGRILRKMQLMTYVNSIITNQEYRNIIRENMHYILGRNAKSESYPEQEITADRDLAEYYYLSVQLMILAGIDNCFALVQ